MHELRLKTNCHSLAELADQSSSSQGGTKTRAISCAQISRLHHNGHDQESDLVFFFCPHPSCCQGNGLGQLQYMTHLGTPDAIREPAAKIARGYAKLASILPQGTSASTICGLGWPAPCLHRNAFLVESGAAAEPNIGNSRIQFPTL